MTTETPPAEKPAAFQKKVFNTGNKIFNQGDKGDAVYLIVSGQVELYIKKGDRSTPVARLGPREIFGEMALLSDNPRGATAVVTEACEVIVVPKAAFDAQMEKVNPVIRSVVRTLTKRLLEKKN